MNLNRPISLFGGFEGGFVEEFIEGVIVCGLCCEDGAALLVHEFDKYVGVKNGPSGEAGGVAFDIFGQGDGYVIFADLGGLRIGPDVDAKGACGHVVEVLNTDAAVSQDGSRPASRRRARNLEWMELRNLRILFAGRR